MKVKKPRVIPKNQILSFFFRHGKMKAISSYKLFKYQLKGLQKKCLSIKHNQNFSLLDTPALLSMEFAKCENLAIFEFLYGYVLPYKKLFKLRCTTFWLIKPTLSLYLKLVACVFRVGKKNIWEDSFTILFDIVAKALHYTRAAMLLAIFTRLFTPLEAAKVKSRDKFIYAPNMIPLKRSVFLALKWLYKSSLQKKGLFSFKEKITTEVLLLLTKTTCSSFLYWEDNNSLLYASRSNTHYRWRNFIKC